MLKRRINVDAVDLIREIKNHPCLWSFHLKNKRSATACVKAWRSISGILGKPVPELRIKWKNLKDAYRKEVKKNFIDGEYQGIWQHFEALDFIRDQVQEARDKVEQLESDGEENQSFQELKEAHEFTGRKIDKNTIKLIAEVKKHDCLWNRDFPLKGSLKNKTMADAFLEVANQMGKKVQQVRSKWKNLKDTYIREVLKNYTNGEYQGVWPYFNMMTFVKTEFVFNTFDPLSDDDSVQSDKWDTKDEILESTFDMTPDNNVVYLDSNEEDALPEKRQKLDEDDDYDIMFLKSLAPFFRNMDNVRKLALRSKIQDMVMKEIANGQS